MSNPVGTDIAEGRVGRDRSAALRDARTGIVARRDTALARATGILLFADAVTFLIASLSHTGIRISFGFGGIAEPQIIPATIVEGISGILLAVGAYGVLARKSWRWSAAAIATAFALAGVILGIAALAVGAGPRTRRMMSTIG